jgi:hypothetical protein
MLAIKELDQVCTRIEHGQAPHQRPQSETPIPVNVIRVVNRAREIAPASLQGIQRNRLETMTEKAIEVAAFYQAKQPK